jgi:hypothetical protein
VRRGGDSHGMELVECADFKMGFKWGVFLIFSMWTEINGHIFVKQTK